MFSTNCNVCSWLLIDAFYQHKNSSHIRCFKILFCFLILFNDLWTVFSSVIPTAKWTSGSKHFQGKFSPPRLCIKKERIFFSEQQIYFSSSPLFTLLYLGAQPLSHSSCFSMWIILKSCLLSLTECKGQSSLTSSLDLQVYTEIFLLSCFAFAS